MKIVVIPPKQKLDYLAETIIEGLYKNKIDVYSSELGNGIKGEDVYTDKEIIKDELFLYKNKIGRGKEDIIKFFDDKRKNLVKLLIK